MRDDAIYENVFRFYYTILWCIIHSDIKQDNILYTFDPDHGMHTFKFIDFRLAFSSEKLSAILYV